MGFCHFSGLLQSCMIFLAHLGYFLLRRVPGLKGFFLLHLIAFYKLYISLLSDSLLGNVIFLLILNLIQ